MSRKQVVCMTPAASIDAANVAFAAITGDDPGAINFKLNASADGNDPATACVANCNLNAAAGSSSSNGAKSEWQDWLDTLAGYSGSGAQSYPPTPVVDSWSLAKSTWGLQQVTIAL